MLSRIEKTVLNLIIVNVTDQSLRIMQFTPGEGHLTKALLDAGYKNIETMDIYPENFKLKEVKCHKGNISEPLPFADALWQMHAPALYFGRTQIILAQKHPHSYIKRK